MATHPTDEQQDALMARTGEGPIRMINLLKFKEHAVYEDGTDGGCANGMEAYLRYGAALQSGILKSYGASIIYSEPVMDRVVGDADVTDYDVVAIVSYPSREAFLEMTQSDDYLEAARHRDAGLEHQALLCCAGNEPKLG